jgi:hypothetical protein
MIKQAKIQNSASVYSMELYSSTRGPEPGLGGQHRDTQIRLGGVTEQLPKLSDNCGGAFARGPRSS